MSKKAAVIIVLIIVVFLYIVLNPLPSGEIITEKDDKVTITILAGQSVSDAGTEEMIDEVLTKKFPDVNFEWICVDWGDRFASQVEGKFLSGNIPDILVGKAQDVKPYKVSGIITSIPKRAYGKIEESMLDIVTEETAVYGIPYTVNFQGVLFNEAIFKQFDLEPPSTIEELEEIVRILEKNEITPFACHFQESWKIGNMNMQFFLNDIFRKEETWGNSFRLGDKNFSDNELMKKLFGYNKYIFEHSFEDAMQINQYECDIRFGRGEAAMYLTGTWSLQAVSQISPMLKMGIFPYPNESGDASLLVETDMTFMKGNKNENSSLVDEILTEIGTNQLLAKEIVDYTGSKSSLGTLQDYGDIAVQDDIGRYRQSGELLNVSVGNSQLVWTYQDNVASETLLWLQGKKSLTDILNYADENRESSIVNVK